MGHRRLRAPASTANLKGMWLAETAVNAHVLDLLAQEGIQVHRSCSSAVRRFRPIGPTDAPEVPWQETPNASVDPTHPYRINLPEGRSISVFFYDGPASRSIAFEGLLNSGDDFGRRIARVSMNLSSTLSRGDPKPQLVHVATDGESYGHHHQATATWLSVCHEVARRDRYCQAHQLWRVPRQVPS